MMISLVLLMCLQCQTKLKIYIIMKTWTSCQINSTNKWLWINISNKSLCSTKHCFHNNISNRTLILQLLYHHKRSEVSLPVCSLNNHLCMITHQPRRDSPLVAIIIKISILARTIMTWKELLYKYQNIPQHQEAVL